MTSPDPERVYFDAVLRPHRSLTPRGFAILMAFFAVLSLIAGVAFLMIGAWPVFGFFGLDIALVYLAFRLNYHSADLFEWVRLTDRSLDIANEKRGGAHRHWAFEPTWVRVQVEEGPFRQAKLTLASRGIGVIVGAFLSPEERRGFAEALRNALQERARALPHIAPSQS
ncbi:MAG: DUF2244 domain-containing protein [Alphaproteobacteria bacterium]|nr:DUF2244 domain-containing protein [Alphaproteobacteria bacterium]